MSGLSLAALREEMWDALGTSQDDPSTSITKVDRWLNRAYWELLDKVNFRQTQETTQFTLSTSNAGPYPATALIAALEAIMHITYNDYSDTNVWYPIKQIAFEKIMDMQNSSTDSAGPPQFWARANNFLYFSPIPDNPYQLQIYYRSTLGDIPVDGPDMPRVWHEIVLQGGLWRAWQSLGSPVRGQAAFSIWGSLVNTTVETETKEQIDNQYAAGAIIRARYP